MASQLSQQTSSWGKPRREFWSGPLVRLLAILIGWTTCASFAIAGSPVIGQPTVGWSGHYVVGRWTPVVVPLTVDQSSTVQLELTAVDSDGNRVGYVSPQITLEPGQQQVSGLIKVGRLDGEVGIHFVNGPQLRALPGRSNWLREPLKPSAFLIVTVGEPSGFDFETTSSKQGIIVKVIPAKPADLPVDKLAYDSISSLVIAGSVDFSPAQAVAIRDWVAAGGQLVISLQHDSAAARRSTQAFADWLPVRVAEEPVVVREFGGLESFAGKNIRIPQSTTLSIPSLQMDAGETLATSRSDSFLVRAPFGMGAVTVLALDLTKKPLNEWAALTPFCERLLGLGSNIDVREKTAIKGSQLSSTGITDLATQLQATQENFEQIHRASPWFVIGLLLLLLVVVGPLDYLIVHKFFKKPHLTWVSFPLLVIVCSAMTSSLATTSNGSTRHVNQLDIVDVDVSTATAWERHFITFYSPTTSLSSVAVEPAPLVKTSNVVAAARVSWHGVPESTFGGTLRPTGLEQGAKYQQDSDGKLSQLPVMQWSSKALVAESVQPVGGLIECDLRASATGRLTGTITHHLSEPIEDWLVAYKNVVYRYLKKKDDPQTLPLPPNQLWRVDQPSVHSRELRPYLTGMITMATPKFGASASTDVAHHQTTYDPLSLDPAGIVRVMTFHDEIGGERYTGLTNQILDDEDCSQLLKLGRAILFGRLRQSIASIQQNGIAIEPDRQTSFVRLILPVARATEQLRGLPRVLPGE